MRENGSQPDMKHIPPSKKIGISLHINTGNVIYEEFEDMQEALKFVQSYYNNPEAILKRITPKRLLGDSTID